MTYPALWTPKHLGSPGGWWRADNVTLTSGKVSTWQDIGGAGRDVTQGTAGNRPTQVASVVNGRHVVRFVGASLQHLVSASFTAIPQPFTIWFVCKAASQGGVPVALGGLSGEAIVYAPSATQVAMFTNGGTFAATFDMTAAFTSFVCVFNGASSALRANGSQIASGTTVEGLSQFAIGAAAYLLGSNPWDGDIADVGFTRQALSGTGRVRLENYMRRRYATW